MTSSIRRFAFCLAFLCAASSAYAAPVAKVSCTSSAQTLTFNVSYFDLGVTSSASTGSSSSGAGAGKATFQPLVVHTSLAQFQSLFTAATTGSVFASCTLTTTKSTGEAIEFTLKLVTVTQVDAIAHSTTADATAYTQATLEYGSVEVTSGSD
jgi:Type VI secretion system effector, Hcp